MEKPILIFLVTALISFAGSLQLGPVNLMVIRAVLRRNFQTGLWIAVGGCLPEMMYATAAIGVEAGLEQQESLWKLLEWSAVPALFIVGIVVFFTPNRPVKLENAPQSFSFFKGLTLGLLNPQLFPYWLVMLVQFKMYRKLHVQTLPEQAAFIIGTAVGALGLLVTVAALTSRFRESLLEKLERLNVNRFLGVLFIVLALVQLVKLYQQAQ
ncbi:MAG: LysE family transporter [Spirosomataceae bacterium]